MIKTIEQETREYFNEIKHNIRRGNTSLVYLSGTKNKRTKMYSEVKHYQRDAEFDYELGVITKEEYKYEMRAIRILEQSLANFVVF